MSFPTPGEKEDTTMIYKRDMKSVGTSKGPFVLLAGVGRLLWKHTHAPGSNYDHRR
jgi:hypothetical protein